jgi:hypothetical protein
MLLAASKLGHRIAIESVDHVLVLKHDLQDLVELAQERVVPGICSGSLLSVSGRSTAQQTFVRDLPEIFGVCLYQVVECYIRFLDGKYEVAPGRFDDL